MGVRRAMYCDKGQNLTLIHLYRLTGSQIICHNDRWLHGTPVNLLLPGQIADEPVGDIPDIRRAGLHIFIIHVGEHLCKIITGHCHRILCIHFFVLNHAVNGILIIVILEHHLMHLENGCIDFSDLLQGLLV